MVARRRTTAIEELRSTHRVDASNRPKTDDLPAVSHGNMQVHDNGCAQRCTGCGRALNVDCDSP